MKAFPTGTTPSPLLGNIPASLRHPARNARPMVRKGWLDHGPGPDARRGSDEFLAVPWDEMLDMLSAEIRRVVDTYSSEAIFGGSYGWSSAGRFHHAQSQVHRFLNICAGGYVRSVNDYSSGAGLVILPHIIAPQEEVTRRSVTWRDILDNAQMIVSFGGIPARNTDVGGGGSSEHITTPSILEADRRGIRMISISPLRDDLPTLDRIEWQPITPASDTALMLAIAYVLECEDLCDRAFLARYCTGYDTFRDYVLGAKDATPKTPEWASAICGINAARISGLARDMAASRTLITVTYSLQRTQHGEQPVWAAVTLAAMLGQIGRKGCGFSFAIGSSGNIGKPVLQFGAPALWQGHNRVKTFIPVARIADMLLHPGQTYDYNGQTLTYPDIRMVYWAGGNPFHHHQDLQRLTRAFAKPETIVLHDPYFTATARHADIVLPSTITLERDDIGASRNDPLVMAMHAVSPPYAEARDDFWMFAQMARRLGQEEAFTEGRDARQWVEHLYNQFRATMIRETGEAPDFGTFWETGSITVPISPVKGAIQRFIDDPEGEPLPTPSGKIEIVSKNIAGFGYADCAGHPMWLGHHEWLGCKRAQQFPLQMIANQPATRLHSQLDFGETSARSKISGREPMRIHPLDAQERGISNGQIVRIFNDRGSCLAGAILSDALMPGVIQLATGAWYQPMELPGIGIACVHGNPNILTPDVATSRLSQACSGQLALVDVEVFHGEVPPVTVHAAPETTQAEPEAISRRINALG